MKKVAKISWKMENVSTVKKKQYTYLQMVDGLREESLCDYCFVKYDNVCKGRDYLMKRITEKNSP